MIDITFHEHLRHDTHPVHYIRQQLSLLVFYRDARMDFSI